MVALAGGAGAGAAPAPSHVRLQGRARWSLEPASVLVLSVRVGRMLRLKEAVPQLARDHHHLTSSQPQIHQLQRPHTYTFK